LPQPPTHLPPITRSSDTRRSRPGARAAMRVSVVVSAFHPGRLPPVLSALRLQTHAEFEVIVVGRPCPGADAVRWCEYPGANRAAARNVGLAAAAGEVVAFLDEGVIPEPPWLAELAAAYDHPRVGGAGGFVYDSTGYRLQSTYLVCDRRGTV